MPKVGKMKFPYTKKGMEEAQNYSAQTGKPMQVEKYQYGGRVPEMRRGMRPGMGRGMNPGVLQALVQGLKKRFKKGGKVK